MSGDEENIGGLHILLGLRSLDEEIQIALQKEFKKRGKPIGLLVNKYSKNAIEQYLKEHHDVDALIVQEHVQESSVYDIADYEKLYDLNSEMVIIPILDTERKGTPFINKLLSLSIFTAIFADNASIAAIADIVINGRIRKEAKRYYGIENFDEDIGNMDDSFSLPSCIEYIVAGRKKEQTVERTEYVRSHLNESDFKLVMAKLPRNIKDNLKTCEDYACYFEEETVTDSNEKKGFFPNKLIKMVMPSQEQSEDIMIPIVRQEVQSAVKKTVIGFSGTQPHIGTTHQTLLFGNYLNAAGYKIAIVESSECLCRCFHTIGSRYNVKDQGDFFTYLDIDYYSNFNLNQLHRIFLNDYNFILIDFGMYSENIAQEFGRCVVQIIISGSKPWEVPMLERLMTLVNNPDILKKINYLFMFTPEDEKKSAVKDMGIYEKVFFSECQADPFSSDGYPAIREILEDFLPNMDCTNRKGQLINLIKKLFE